MVTTGIEPMTLHCLPLGVYLPYRYSASLNLLMDAYRRLLPRGTFQGHQQPRREVNPATLKAGTYIQGSSMALRTYIPLCRDPLSSLILYNEPRNASALYVEGAGAHFLFDPWHRPNLSPV